jgi:uncharacterized membrane-anchored protein YhcB (DUF1043 family)
MLEQLGLQLETIEAIIVALGTSFLGTGTVALVVKVALGRVTKQMTNKVLLAEKENKITTNTALKSLESIKVLEDGLKSQIDGLKVIVDDLIKTQTQTNQSVASLLEEYKSRDEQIKELIVQEFGDDIE